MRLLMLGLDNAGKTTIVKRFKGDDINKISPTLGFNIDTVQYDEYQLVFWDVGGQQTLRSYWRNYYEETDGLVWVVDSSDTRRLKDCKKELDKLLFEEKLAGASLLILANKQDLESSLSLEEISEILELDKIKKRHWKIVACSAVTGDGLLDGIEWVVSDIANRIYSEN
ncbi:adp-ribosylation factor-like protein [Anaeramoeba flamelloides]|nr:adp-ribosylation factor-like protein [Anaeramoeba flamelloides]